MAPRTESAHPTIHAPGLGTEPVVDLIVDALADQPGLSVRRVDHGRIAVACTRRPRAALVAGVLTIWIGGLGLLFLLVRRTEAGHVTVNEGPRGSTVTLPALLDRALVEDLRERLGPVAPTRPEPAPFRPSSDLDATTTPRRPDHRSRSEPVP